MPSAVPLVVVLGLALVGCGDGDADTADAAGAVDTEATQPIEVAPDDEGSPGSKSEETDAPDGSFGLGSATVTFGDEVHRFAISPERSVDGQCRVLFGVLAMDLPLVESNGVAVDPGNGWLAMTIELEDVADLEPSVEMRAGGGHWFAGDSETASISGIETPEITLAGDGMSITGTQPMVPIVAGPGEPIEATVEASCE